jgi:lantibiotic modifying enzyme
MEVFIPQNEGEATQQNFGEFHTRFTPQDGIQDVHQFYPRFEKLIDSIK